MNYLSEENIHTTLMNTLDTNKLFLDAWSNYQRTFPISYKVIEYIGMQSVFKIKFLTILEYIPTNEVRFLPKQESLPRQ